MRFFKEEIQARRDIEREERLEQENAAALHFLFSNHRELLDCRAARKLIHTFFEGAPLSAELLQDAMHTSLYQMLPKQSPEEDREKLEQAITKLLVGGGSPDAVRHEAAKFRFKSIEELAAWHDKLKVEHELRQKTPEQLRQIIKATPVSQFMPVPPVYQNRSMLISLANENVAEFKTLVRKCGQNQINAILQKKQ